MRYVVFGAGAVGATIGGKLHQSGRSVVLIARGPHLAALEARGLRLESPDSSVTLQVPVAAKPAKAVISHEDVVILSMKSQDTEEALDELADSCGSDTPVVCAQNGVQNERLALRRFRHVYGMFVVMPAEHLTPGLVQYHGSPTPGVADIGKYPIGTGDLSGQIAADLTNGGFASRPLADVMRWKYAKLLRNLGNAASAACGSGGTAGATPRIKEIASLAQIEARACFQAAGIVYASDEEFADRTRLVSPLRQIGDQTRVGSSSEQSLARMSGRMETDYFNGEIVLIGRLHGLDTPVNETLQRVANQMARARMAPGSLPIEKLEAELASAGVTLKAEV